MIDAKITIGVTLIALLVIVAGCAVKAPACVPHHPVVEELPYKRGDEPIRYQNGNPCWFIHSVENIWCVSGKKD